MKFKVILTWILINLFIDVLKFIGIKNDKMSFKDFLDFYKKNLW